VASVLWKTQIFSFSFLIRRAYNLQDQGLDTVDANLQLGHPVDARTYDEAALILKDLGVKTVRLLTNNADKIERLREEGIVVTERVEMVPQLLTPDNYAYLATKVERMRHTLDLRSLSSTMSTPVPPTSDSEASASSSSSSSSSSPSVCPLPSSASLGSIPDSKHNLSSKLLAEAKGDGFSERPASSSPAASLTANAARAGPVRPQLSLLPNYFF